MPTIRSHFNYAQFEKAFQKLAHEIALDAVTSLQRGDVRIVIRGPRLGEVSTSTLHIRFYARHLSYSKTGRDEWWGFDVEKKLYITSDHCTKISFWASEEKVEEVKKKVMEFIDKLMADVKPVPRFSLSKFAGAKA